MPDVTVHLWVGDQDDVVSYTVSVPGGVTDTEAALAAAREEAEADGYEELNLKEMEPA